MKRILGALLIVGLASSIAWADWLADFNDTYKNKNIDEAVENALKEGITPDIIVEKAMIFPDINPQNIVKALYCAGVGGQDVYEAAEKSKISEMIVTAGFKKSVEECGDRVVDTQPYTPGAAAVARTFGLPRTSSTSPVNVSPETF
jgi:hypothetical protein